MKIKNSRWLWWSWQWWSTIQCSYCGVWKIETLFFFYVQCPLLSLTHTQWSLRWSDDDRDDHKWAIIWKKVFSSLTLQTYQKYIQEVLEWLSMTFLASFLKKETLVVENYCWFWWQCDFILFCTVVFEKFKTLCKITLFNVQCSPLSLSHIYWSYLWSSSSCSVMSGYHW